MLAAVVVSAVVLLVPAVPASAYTWYCTDGNSNPNNTDNCWVHTSDYQEYWISEVTQNEIDCDPVHYTRASIRVRLYGDYQPGKFKLRQFSLRYLSGTKPWLYVQIDVWDGNGNAVNRDWNNNGNYIWNDGAGRDVDNTMNLSVPTTYAPVFDTNKPVTFRIYGKETARPDFFDNYGACYVGAWWLRVQPSNIP
jgi:hypothetical protein